jgi:hypothetical protein
MVIRERTFFHFKNKSQLLGLILCHIKSISVILIYKAYLLILCTSWFSDVFLYTKFPCHIIILMLPDVKWLAQVDSFYVACSSQNIWLRLNHVRVYLSFAFSVLNPHWQTAHKFKWNGQQEVSVCKWALVAHSDVRLQNCQKQLLALSEWLSYDKTDFHEIWYLRFLWKSVKKIQVSLKSGKNNEHFKWRPMYIYNNI